VFFFSFLTKDHRSVISDPRHTHTHTHTCIILTIGSQQTCNLYLLIRWSSRVVVKGPYDNDQLWRHGRGQRQLCRRGELSPPKF